MLSLFKCGISCNINNLEREGPIDSEGCPGIFTAKPVQALLGDRVWLVSGEGRPRTYYLNGSFEVRELSPATHEGEMNEVWGDDLDRWLEKPVRIDTEPWFKDLKRATGNFAFGLQRISDGRVTKGLRDALLISAQDQTRTGAKNDERLRFGTPEANKEVEVAAVKAVTKEYQSKGWKVVSHEDRRDGYDLYCTKLQAVHYVEVKGARGRDCSFIITANELDFSCGRDSFRLCVVTNALDQKLRKTQIFTANELASKFEFEPLAFSARLN